MLVTNFLRMKTPLDLLKTVFGFSQFRGKQEEVIAHVLAGKDALTIMPTGAGKSLCFQLPALCLPGLTVVISPLIALMKDQVDALNSNGVQARCYHSNMSDAEMSNVLNQLRKGQVKLLYLSPERLFQSKPPFIDELKRHSISLFAIDEAHCISHWGHDFREDYLVLGKLKLLFPNVPTIALTATADTLTRNDILEKLSIQNAQVFLSSFDRPNIYYKATYRANLLIQIDSYLQNKKGECGIIYCLSRRDTETLAEELSKLGYQAIAYHAGLDKKERDKRQDAFKNDQVMIIVATIAFGMGIDKPNVRFVIHACLPKNMESYYQETGRAGRDGLESEVLLLYTPGDIRRLQFFIYNASDNKHKAEALQKLDEMAQFAETEECRRKLILNYFDEESPERCGRCDNCSYKSETSVVRDFSLIIQVLETLGGQCQKEQLFSFLLNQNTESLPKKLRQHPLLGKGKNKALNHWQEIINQLHKEKRIEIINDGICLRKEIEGSVYSKKPSAIQKVKKITSEEEKKQLYESLKIWRAKRAREESVPAYIIFNDATLDELVERRPFTQTSLKEITGFGEIKVEKYAIELLPIIRNLSKERILKQAAQELEKQKASKNSHESYRLLKMGHQPEEIAQLSGFSLATIYKHLEGYVFSGDLQPNDLLPQHKTHLINTVLETHGLDLLSAIKEKLPEDIDYREIGIVRASWLRKSTKDLAFRQENST